MGWAAPTLVLGAIAATGQPMRMKVPADAARDPGGPTQHTTGTGEAWIDLTIECIDDSNPPGVSRRTSTAAACASVASPIARSTARATAASMPPSIAIS
jgi:hypothetical protein